MGKAVHTAMKVAALLALCLATAVLADAGASNDAEISFVETESKTQSKFVPFALGWGLGYGFGFPFGYPYYGYGYGGYGYSPFYPFMHNAARGFAAKAKAAQSFIELEEVDAQAGTQAQMFDPFLGGLGGFGGGFGGYGYGSPFGYGYPAAAGLGSGFGAPLGYNTPGYGLYGSPIGGLGTGLGVGLGLGMLAGA